MFCGGGGSRLSAPEVVLFRAPELFTMQQLLTTILKNRNKNIFNLTMTRP